MNATDRAFALGKVRDCDLEDLPEETEEALGLDADQATILRAAFRQFRFLLEDKIESQWLDGDDA